MFQQQNPKYEDIFVQISNQQNKKEKIESNMQGMLRKFQFKWKFIIFLVLNFYLFSGALAFAFPQYYNFNRTTLLPLNVIFILIMILDLVFQLFLIPKMNQSQFQLIVFQSFRKNAKKYMKYAKYYLINQKLLWDILILVLFCLHYMPDYDVGRYFGLIIIFKLSDMVSYNNQIYKRLHAKPFARSVYTITKIIYLMALLTHYLGLFFYVIDQTLIQNQYFGTIAQNPAVYYQGMSLCFTPIQSQSLFQRYIWAAYYSSSLISTIAYGDIIPKNYFQNIYVCFLMILSTLFIALLLQQFMILVRQEKFGEYQFIKQFNCLKQFMNQKLVPIQIQNAIRSYLVYLQYQKKLKNQKPVMDSLTKKLQKKILYFGYFNLYQQKFRVLGLNNKEILYQIGLLMEQVVCQAQYVMLNPFLSNKQLQDNENLQNHQFEFHNPSLYFIYQGKLQQFTKYDHNSNQFNLLIIDSSDNRHQKAFNMYQFITGSQLRYGIKTIQLTKLIKFNPKTFLDFILKYEQVYKIFKLNKQKVLCQELSQQNVDGSCFICKKNDHTFVDCPQCHYSLKQKIQDAIKLSILLASQKYTNQRALKKRNNIIKSKKIINICHQSAVWQKFKRKNLNFVYDVFLSKTTKQLLNIQIDSKDFKQQTKYDPNGIEPQFQI